MATDSRKYLKHLSRKQVNWTDSADLQKEPYGHRYERDEKRVGGISIQRSMDGRRERER